MEKLKEIERHVKAAAAKRDAVLKDLRDEEKVNEELEAALLGLQTQVDALENEVRLALPPLAYFNHGHGGGGGA